LIGSIVLLQLIHKVKKNATMKKEILILFCCALITFNSCKRETVAPDTFTFGRFCGFCVGDCATVFKLDNNQLFADDMKEGNRSAPLRFQNTPLSEAKKLIVKQLADAFPAQLRSETAEQIGCPDCVDQCGYLVVWTQNGATKQWYIDTMKDAVPAYLQPFVVKIRETLLALQ
jgi:hypothetical protein